MYARRNEDIYLIDPDSRNYKWYHLLQISKSKDVWHLDHEKEVA